jgi:hypothetical protein
LLVELEKTGNVFTACSRTGISRATFYRWKEEQKEFKEKADRAAEIGIESNCDIAEHSLMLKIKDKDLGAIKYLLSHNSPRYKEKEKEKRMVTDRTMAGTGKYVTLNGFGLNALYEMYNHKDALRLKKNWEEFGFEIPPKLDGSEIDLDDLPDYIGYIRDWNNYKNGDIPLP